MIDETMCKSIVVEFIDHKTQKIFTPFGEFLIGPMKVSDDSKIKLVKILAAEFEFCGQPHLRDSVRLFAECAVRTWDKMRQ